MVFVTLPAFVIVPIALISLTSPSTNPSPVTVTSGAVSGMPSYALFALSDFRFTVRLFTVSVPLSFSILANCSVTSASSFLIITDSTLFSVVPAFVMLPLTVASAVKPSGSPVTL